MNTTTSEAAPKREANDGEPQTRVNLAAAFRIAHHLGWNDGINNHITARLPDAPEHFLMNPRTHGWHEVTASSLVKADLDGEEIGSELRHMIGDKRRRDQPNGRSLDMNHIQDVGGQRWRQFVP